MGVECRALLLPCRFSSLRFSSPRVCPASTQEGDPPARGGSLPAARPVIPPASMYVLDGPGSDSFINPNKLLTLTHTSLLHLGVEPEAPATHHTAASPSAL